MAVVTPKSTIGITAKIWFWYILFFLALKLLLHKSGKSTLIAYAVRRCVNKLKNLNREVFYFIPQAN